MQQSLRKANEIIHSSKNVGIDFIKFARGEVQELEAFLGEIEVDISIEETLTKGHAYFLLLDGDGRPRLESFTQELAHFALEYVIPRSRIKEAEEEYKRTRSPHAFNSLQQEAKNLFTELDKSGEGGELLLFWLRSRKLRGRTHRN